MAHVSELLETAATLFAVTPDELRGPSGARRIAHARFALAWAIHQHEPDGTDCSFAAIGALLGGHDHTTILYAIERAEQFAYADADYALRLADLRPEGASCEQPLGTVNPPQPTSLRDYVEPALEIALEEQLDANAALAAAAARHADLDTFANSWDRMSALGWGLQIAAEGIGTLHDDASRAIEGRLCQPFRGYCQRHGVDGAAPAGDQRPSTPARTCR